MSEHDSIKNIFKLEGSVYRISELKSGININTGKEWSKYEILLCLESGQQNMKYYYPVIFWNGLAKSVSDRLQINDYVIVEGQLVSRDYQNIRDGVTNYFINLTGYKVNVLVPTLPTDDIITNNVTDFEDDVPF